MFGPLAIQGLLAISFIVDKHLISSFPPLLYIGSRILCAGIMLLVYTTYTHGLQFIMTNVKNAWYEFSKLTLIHSYISFGTTLIALELVSSAEASLLYNLTPCFTAMFAYTLYKQPFNLYKKIGLIVCTLSLLYLFSGRLLTDDMSTSSTIGIPLLIFSVAMNAYAWLFFNDIQQRYNFSETFLCSIDLTAGGILLLLTSLMVEQWHINGTWTTIIPLFITMLLTIDIGYINLYGYLLSYYSATLMSLSRIIAPFITAAISSFLLNEAIPDTFTGACMLMGIGLYIFYSHDE